MPDRRFTPLLALAAVLLACGPARHARADQPSDDRDRAAAAHTRERNVSRSRGGAASSESAPAAAPPQDPQLICDRACLQAVADGYLKALVAHDPKLLVAG